MELTASTFTKLGVLAVILAIFAVVGWRVGAPEDFQRTLASAGLAQQSPAAAPAPAQQEPVAPAATPQTPAPPPQQPESSDSGH